MRARAHALVAVLVVLLAACGPSNRTNTIRTTLVSVNAARDGFLVFDEDIQTKIVDKSTSLADGQNKLDAYRAHRAEVVAAFEVVYRALAIAAVDPDKADLAEVLIEVKQLFYMLEKLKDADPPKPEAEL